MKMNWKSCCRGDTAEVCTKYQIGQYIVEEEQNGATVLPHSEENQKFVLSWSLYLVLMRIKNDDELRL